MRYVQLKSVTIEGPEPVAVNVDGEVSDAKRLHYVARSRDLWVHVVHLPGEAEASADG